MALINEYDTFLEPKQIFLLLFACQILLTKILDLTNCMLKIITVMIGECGLSALTQHEMYLLSNGFLCT